MSIRGLALNQEFEQLVRQGQYDDAMDVANRALQLVEAETGPQLDEWATCLLNIATIFRIQSHYPQAEPPWRSAKGPWDPRRLAWPRC